MYISWHFLASYVLIVKTNTISKTTHICTFNMRSVEKCCQCPLMMKICKLNLFDCKDISELDRDDDMLPTEACTSSLQTWHRKGRRDSTQPQPLMEVNVKKPKLDDCSLNTKRPVTSSKESGVQCYSLRSSEQLEDPGK